MLSPVLAERDVFACWRFKIKDPRRLVNKSLCWNPCWKQGKTPHHSTPWFVKPFSPSPEKNPTNTIRVVPHAFLLDRWIVFLDKRHLYGKHSGSMGCHQSSERVLVALSELQLVAGYLENKKTNVFSCVHLSKKVHGDRVACKVFSIVSKFNCLRYCQFYECALSLSSIQTLSVKLAKTTFS